MHLYQFRFPRVGQDLEQILVRNEVESREHVSFRLQILFQRSLHQLEFATDFIQNLEQAGWSENEEERKKEGKLGGAEEKNANASGRPDLHYFLPPSLFLFQRRTSLPLLPFELQRILTFFLVLKFLFSLFPFRKFRFLNERGEVFFLRN